MIARPLHGLIPIYLQLVKNLMLVHLFRSYLILQGLS